MALKPTRVELINSDDWKNELLARCGSASVGGVYIVASNRYAGLYRYGCGGCNDTPPPDTGGEDDPHGDTSAGLKERFEKHGQNGSHNTGMTDRLGPWRPIWILALPEADAECLKAAREELKGHLEGEKLNRVGRTQIFGRSELLTEVDVQRIADRFSATHVFGCERNHPPVAHVESALRRAGGRKQGGRWRLWKVRAPTESEWRFDQGKLTFRDTGEYLSLSGPVGLIARVQAHLRA